MSRPGAQGARARPSPRALGGSPQGQAPGLWAAGAPGGEKAGGGPQEAPSPAWSPSPVFHLFRVRRRLGHTDGLRRLRGKLRILVSGPEPMTLCHFAPPPPPRVSSELARPLPGRTGAPRHTGQAYAGPRVDATVGSARAAVRTQGHGPPAAGVEFFFSQPLSIKPAWGSPWGKGYEEQRPPGCEGSSHWGEQLSLSDQEENLRPLEGGPRWRE